MRFFSLFLSILLLGSVLQAGTNPTKRYLVGPNSEVIPLSPEEVASSAVKKFSSRSTSAAVCTDKFTFGYPPTIYTVNSNFGAYHRDVLGEWFVAPATGTIDTIFWFNRALIGAYDSTIFLRVHASNIGPTYGPGIRPGTFNPPCQNWGYWVNSNDCDNGVAAFIEEATAPGAPWVSTINGSPIPSGPPFSGVLWGQAGFPKLVHPNTQENVAMEDLATLTVTQGDKFFISMRVAEGGPNCGHKVQTTEEDRTEWNAAGFTVGTNDPDYPSRNWKFYEHEKGPSNCAGFPIDSIQAGWVARGGFGADSLTVAAYNFWYVMTVTSNVPPIITNVDQVHTTFATTPWTVQADIEDCDPSGGIPGVATAVLRWNKNGVSQTDIPMSFIGGTTWEGTLPGEPANTDITYKVVAADAANLVGQSAANAYSVVELGNEWYSIDTAASCTNHDISASAPAINPSSFFNPNYTGSGTAPKDDGSAGPFNMGGNYVVFGDTFRYAWVGVNGGISLTKSATDTNDVNANGFATTAWNFPYTVVHHGRNDSVDITGMPRMFISPFWADHIVQQDSPAATFGHIRTGNDGDACLFIAEWDSVGTFDTNGSTQDITTFRVVLNRCDGTIEFQYKSCGLNGLDSAAIVGMQYDTSSVAHPNPFLFLNRLTYPYETKPRDNYCVRFKPTVGASVADGWNMVSVSGTPSDANYAKTHLFPEATSAAFAYGAGYVTAPTLSNGPGYWMKFSGGARVGSIPANWLSNVVVNVQDKWNMIGSVSGFVPTSSIVPGGGASFPGSPTYYGYANGYSVATSLEPGKAYWVKVNGPGTLTLTASAMAPKAQPTAAEIGLGEMNTVTITDNAGRSQTLYFGEEGLLKSDVNNFEMPPAPPAGGFDARFSASGRMVEIYPAKTDKAVEFPISIQSAVYPVTVSWSLGASAEGRSFEVVAGSKSTSMTATGSKQIDAGVKSVVIRLVAGTTPKEFALSQNYPNPFNPVTRFRVDVAKTSQVEVSVYDILGRKVVSLLNAEKAEGTYTMEWNGKDAQGLTMPTGMYFIRMNAGEFSDSKKIMLMK